MAQREYTAKEMIEFLKEFPDIPVRINTNTNHRSNTYPTYYVSGVEIFEDIRYKLIGINILTNNDGYDQRDGITTTKLISLLEELNRPEYNLYINKELFVYSRDSHLIVCDGNMKPLEIGISFEDDSCC